MWLKQAGVLPSNALLIIVAHATVTPASPILALLTIFAGGTCRLAAKCFVIHWKVRYRWTEQSMNRKDHWEQVYQTKAPEDVSWFQARPEISLRLIEANISNRADGVIDVGGGASVLVDFLVTDGFKQLAVLDISAAALEHARQRLGKRAVEIAWFEADVTQFNPPHRFCLWHDRAVFHFLTNETDRRKYVETLNRTLTPEGHVIIATFAKDGPLKCSGLGVCRYDAATICAELGPRFKLIEQVDETHITPWETQQKFSYYRFKQLPG